MQKPKFLSKILLLCLVVSAVSGVTFAPQGQAQGAGSPAFVQGSVVYNYNKSAAATTLQGSVTAGDVLAAIVFVDSQSVALTGVSSTCSGNLTLLDNPTKDGTSSFAAMAYGIITSSGSCTVTATLSGSTSGNFGLAVHEISGINTTTPLDGSAMNTQTTPGTGANAVTSGSITTTNAGDYIFGATSNARNQGSWSPAAGTGYTQRELNGAVVETEDRIQSSAGSVAATFTDNLGYDDTITGIMAFQPGSGGSGSGDTQAPTVPTNLSATAVSSSAINLSWTASTDNVGVTGYTIYRGGVQVGISATNSYSDTGLTASTQYTYTVDAYDAAGNHSAQSSSASATTQAAAGDTTPPTTPTNLSATAVSSSAINLSWTASTDNVGVTGYKVYRNSSQIGTSATNSYSDTGLTASTLYSYTVSAYDAAGNNSSQSSSASATTQASSGGGSWSTLPVDLIMPMNVSSPGTTLTTAIANAGTVSSLCTVGGSGSTGCSYSTIASGLTVGANQNSCSNLGAVQVSSGGPLYAAQSLNYNNVAHADTSFGSISLFTFNSGIRPTNFKLTGCFALGMPGQQNGNDYDMVWIQDSNGLGPIMQIEDACGGSAGQFGVNIEVTSPFSHATCIRLNPNATYYMSLNWDTVDSTATLAVYTIQGTLVGQTSDTAPGGPVTQIRMSSNENGTDSGTTYYQNVMMQWTSTSDTPLFWTSTAGTDTTPPSTPANLSATAVSSSAVNLSWTASTDNVGVTGYKIFRGGVQIGTSATNSYSDTGLSASTQYSYTVSAYDAAGNNSSQSSSASVTTQAAVQQTGSYPWSGILTPSRAIDWSQAGVTGGIPTNQTQCVTSACQAVTANGANSTTAQIQAAWASAPANTYVFLPAGTYTGVTSLSLSGVSSVTLRGAGANQTIIPGPITLGSSDGNSAGAPNNGPVLVSGNVSQGSTTITLASVPHLKVGNPIILDQTDTTNDNGGVLVLGSDSNYTGQFTAPGNAGPYSLDGEVQNARCPGGEDTPSSCYHQEQIVIVISCNGVTTAGASCSGTNVAVGIRSPLHLSNWSTANNMSAWWGNAPVQYSGIEDLTSDNTNSPGANGIQLSNCSNCWVKGVTVIDTNLSHVQANWGTNDSVVDSYFFLTQNHVTSSYGVVCNSASNMLIQNNIFQAVASPVIWNGTCDGAVVGYNYDINNYYTQSSGYNQNFYGEHGAGINTNLVEGNVANQADADNIHGTANLDTFFRNVFSGPLPACWASGSTYAASTYEACNGGLDPVEVWSYHRFYNVIGNILGTSGVNTAYNPGTENNDAVYQIGVGDTLPNDPNSQATVMLWGNCDSATGFGSCRFVSGEVPSALTGVQAVYSNPVPSSNVLPPSFYLSAKPAWWGSMPWPAIGPDVTGGNITGVGGHAYIIPAEACYNSMGGLSTGGGPLLSFNAANCFPGDFSSSGGSGSSPTISSFSASPSTITYGASTTLSWSVSGATTISIDNGLGVQSGNSVSVSPTVTTTYTLTATNSNGSITSQATVTVDPAPDTTPPTASITSPSTGTDSGTITFSATASDPNVTGQVTSGLKLVTLFVDGSVFATSTSGSISVPLDTTTLTNASHTLTATAIDNAGNNSTVSSVTITVNNTVATKYPRTLSLSSLEGISAIPAGTTITATVISPGSGATLETQSNLTATAGKYTVTFLSGDPQLVNIRVKANGYLSQLLTSVDTTVNSASALTVPQLTAGDLNNDNVVNSLDYSLMNSNWLKSGTGDINGDGIVNSLDFAILKNDWGKSGN